MFDIGFAELVVLAVVGLLVLGPERLPEAARTLGVMIGRLRRSFNSLRDEVQRELEAEELRKRLEAERKQLGLEELARSIEQSVRDTPTADSGKPAIAEPAETPPAEGGAAAGATRKDTAATP